MRFMTIASIIDSDRPALLGRPIAFRLTEDERDRLLRLAKLHDRTPGSEVRRAVRYYLAHVETVDRQLRKQAEVVC
jgi:predicted DNA-binding protein